MAGALVLALGGFLSAILPAAAQDGLAIRVDAVGTCPKEKELAKLRGSTEEILRSQYQIAQPEVYLSQGADLFDKVHGEPLAFGEKVVVYVRGKGQPAPYFVYVSRSGKCGWLADEAVWSVENPLKLVDIPGYRDARGVDHKKSTLLAKIVARGVNAEGKLFQVPVYTKPFDPAATTAEEEKKLKVGTANYFAILNVYQYRSGKDSRSCKDIADRDCFFLVGGLSEAKDGAAPVPQIHGWVQTRNVTLWPSALSVYYREGQSDVKIYRSEPAALSVIQGRSPADKDVLAFLADRYTEPRKQNIPRFPVVDGKTRGGKQVFQIIFAGEACPIGDPSCLERAVSGVQKGRGGEDPAGRGAALGRNVDRVRGIDVLLVIDGTESMEKYYPYVIEAVEKTAAVAKAQGQRTRFAAATFGDYEGELADQRRLAFRWVARFGAEGATSHIHRLGRGRVGEDKHGDLVEAPFASIVRAVGEAQWSPDNLYRLVVWIGDAGNRDPGRHATPTGKVKSITETFTEEDVAAALGQAQTAFAAIQVRGKADPEQLQLFERNANVIRRLLGTDKLGALPVRLAETGGEATPDEIVASVHKQLLAILEASAVGESYIENVASGREGKLGLSPQARIARHYVEDVLKLNKDEVRRRAGEVQAILAGFVVQVDADPDFAYWLALRQEDFARLHRQTTDLCDALGGSLNVDNISDTMSAVVRSVTYEDPRPDEPLDRYFKRLLGVPKAALSDIMGYTIRGFAEWYVKAEAHEQGRYRARICAKQKMLELINSRRRVRLSDIEWRDGRASIARNAKQEEFYWDWSTGTGLKYYFVPLELLP